MFIVEDTQKIVSTLCLIPQRWTYAGIPFTVGRVEAVATHPDYRRRGLVRKLFDAAHTQSAALGHLAQGITGIHWFYRQFGYEYALELGGGRIAYFSAIPAARESAPYRLRALTLDDIPFAARLYDRDCARSLVACPRTDALWRHILFGYSADSGERRPHYIIETNDGRAVGYLAHWVGVGGDAFRIAELAVSDEASVRAVALAILPTLKEMAKAEAAKDNKQVETIFFQLGRAHPLFDAIPDLLPKPRAPYGWYIRMPDLPRFLRHIAPALETRLAQSVIAGFSGDLPITNYRDGLRITFERGKIARVELWECPEARDAHANFPPLVFLQLVFGYRSLEELRAAYPDCTAKDEAAVLLDALFPKERSWVMPLG